MEPAQSAEFVASLVRNGADGPTMIAILRNAGWSEKQAVAALSAHFEAATGMAVPSRPVSIGGPKEAYLHLLALVTLAVWCIAAGSLWFTLIDLSFPDPGSQVFGDPVAGMAFNLAQVLVAFPICLLVFGRLYRELTSGESTADSSIRRWLVYLALFLAAGTVIGDLVVFVSQFLQSSITARFLSKCAVVFLIAGGVFWHFLGSVQASGDDRTARLRRYARAGLAASTAFVLLTLGLSFAKFGSPASQRLALSDQRRSRDLESIAKMIRSRWVATRGQDQALPASLTDWPESAGLRLKDPATGVPYRYRPVAGARYELCAVFETDTTLLPEGMRGGVFRIHPKGEHCFAVDAPAELP